MIKQEDLKYKNNLYYYKNKLFTGQVINYYGDKFWYKEGKYHSDNDLPTMEYVNGTKYWYKDGKEHRDNGPAIAYSDGSKYWCKEGKLHRENDLPAAEHSDGTKMWYKEGKRHRENGPALEYSNGKKYWYYNGKEINCKDNKEFLRIIKLFLFK